MSVIGGLNRMSLQSFRMFFRAVRLSWSFGVRLVKEEARRFMLIFRSEEKESRNSSHSSIMSRSVFGFLANMFSIWYFIELNIRTSASRYAVYWSVHGHPFFLWNRANSLPDTAVYLIFFTSVNPFGFISEGMIGAQ